MPLALRHVPQAVPEQFLLHGPTHCRVISVHGCHRVVLVSGSSIPSRTLHCSEIPT